MYLHMFDKIYRKDFYEDASYVVKSGSVRAMPTMSNLSTLDTSAYPRSKKAISPRNGVVSSDTVINSQDLWFRCFTPTTTTTHGGDDGRSLPIIVYIHGGGFAFYSASSTAYDSWCRRISGELNAVVVSINYRLAPEHRCPTQYEDCFDTLKFLDENLDKLPVNVNPKLCFIARDSAGGNLVHHMAVKASEYEFSSLKLIGLISIQPFFGGEERTESEIRNSGGLLLSVEDTDWYWKMFLPDGSDRDHPAVNVFGVWTQIIGGYLSGQVSVNVDFDWWIGFIV
ncbi:hypothetical protein Q3G72_016406 [Acer saccharum]|nr:hypothetical protein Q3G72_016406 [Acer saccharum]